MATYALIAAPLRILSCIKVCEQFTIDKVQIEPNNLMEKKIVQETPLWNVINIDRRNSLAHISGMKIFVFEIIFNI